jgi:F-type H+-transporting ATPase subunit b
MNARRLASALVLGVLAAASAQAAGGEHAEHGGGAGDLLYHVLNFALLVAVLVWFGRKPVRTFLAERRVGIVENLKGAEGVLAEAESRLTEWQRKIRSLDVELEQIRATARDRAEAERARILADAEAVAERIRRDAASVVGQEVRRAQAALRREAGDLAVEIAERLLREGVTQADRARLVDEFVQRIAAPPAGGAAGRGN